MNTKIEWQEIESRTKVPRIFDSQTAFQELFGQVTIFAIDKIKYEWNAAKLLYLKVYNQPIPTHCACEITTRYALPCQHRLVPMVAENRAIPLSLLHPHWLIKGPIAPFTWTMLDIGDIYLLD